MQTHWEYAAQTKMGKYLTDIETNFISKTLDLTQQNLGVLDVGAEAGRFSLFAEKINANVVSIDLNSYALKRLKLKSKQVNVIQADARFMPIKSEVFDIIFMIEVLDYISEIELALKDAKRTLKPNAHSIISFGNKNSIKAKMKAVQGKSYRHSYTEFMRSLSKVGFNINDKLGYSWLPLSRTSQSSFISILATMEKIFGLRRIVRYSPWVMMNLTKIA